MKAIGATGRVALYGILFDTGKADVKPESKPALDEIAKLMKSDAQLKLRVVGHTDNQGGLDANIALSKRRAEAVNAASLDEHVAAVRALDRVLTAGRYVIPVSYPRVSRIAHAARLHFPDHETLYGDWPGFLPDLWWSDAP